MRTSRLASAALTAALTITLATPVSAATDRGLFGSADPTYDGAYRQSLAIVALDAADAPVPPTAAQWLAAQQCADGSFTAYRAATSAPCPAPDPEAFSGPDSNSTALAALALRAVGRDAAARRAINALLAAQNTDGGWGYTLGGASDTNSTGLVLAALGDDRGAAARAAGKGRSYLRSVLAPCVKGAAGLPFQAGSAANDLASAQALAGMVDALDAEPAERPAPTSDSCRVSPRLRLAAFLADRLADGSGLLTSAMDGKTADVNATAWAVLALVAAERAPSQVQTATRALAGKAASFVRSDGVVQPAAAAMLALVAQATDGSPRSFGGVDPIALIADSVRR